MRRRFRDSALTLTVIVTGLSLFALAIGWPAVALIAKSLAQSEPPTDGWTYSPRQLGLLGRSGLLAGLGTVVSLLVSLPGAYVFGQARGAVSRSLVAASFAVLLLCPPMVYAFGWERVLPTGFNAHLRCIGVWALWAWPIPAVLIGTGWSRSGRSAYEAALLESTPVSAFFRVALPPLRNHLALSALIVFVLLFGDYGVPHACGLLVFATELLGWAAGSTRTIDALWPGLMGVGIVMLALWAMVVAWRRCFAGPVATVAAPPPRSTSGVLWVLAAMMFAVSWLLPIGALVVRVGSAEPLAEAFRVYGRDLAWSLWVALLGGIIAMAMGLGTALLPRWRMPALVWAVVLGAMPGALIGECLIAAYNYHRLWWLFDYWPIIALGHASRFGWVGLGTAIVVVGSSADLVAQARSDGAGRLSILARIHIPIHWPTIVGGVAVVFALSIAEVAACSLTRVPGFGPISLILLDKFHFFEDEMLISLSLWLIAASLPGAVLIALAMKRAEYAVKRRRSPHRMVQS